MTSVKKISNVHDESHDKKRNFVDPATLSVSGVILFVLAEAMKAIVGFLTLQWFARLWKRWTSDTTEEHDTRVSKKEQRNPDTHCPCGRCHGG